MATKTLKVKKKSVRRTETDGAYFLKLVLFVIIGSQWVFIGSHAADTNVPLPAGMLIGAYFALRDRRKIDRKIELAILLVACLVGFWTQTGFSIRI